jgi:adenylate kinase
LSVYNKQTQPLIKFYKEQNKFTSVIGIGSIEEIFNSICAVIDSL